MISDPPLRQRSLPSHSSAPTLFQCLTLWVQGAVGKQPMGDVVTAVKRLMLIEALTRSAGNISGASELLGISRQGVQQMIDRAELRRWVDELRRSAPSASVAPLTRGAAGPKG